MKYKDESFKNQQTLIPSPSKMFSKTELSDSTQVTRPTWRLSAWNWTPGGKGGSFTVAMGMVVTFQYSTDTCLRCD